MNDKILLYGLIGFAGVVAVTVGFAIRLEIQHPCLRYETHWDSYHWIGTSTNGDMIYGPGEVRECAERRP